MKEKLFTLFIIAMSVSLLIAIWQFVNWIDSATAPELPTPNKVGVCIGTPIHPDCYDFKDLQMLKKKIDFLADSLPEKEKCRYEDEFVYIPSSLSSPLPSDSWYEKCDKYIETIPEHYKIP